MTPLRTSSKGFTIVEVMIATLVFSVILLLITFGVIQITRTYYKGVTASRTQQTARAIIDDISQTIQFSGSTVSSTPAPSPGANQAFCLNGKRYSYTLGRKLIDGTNHVLVVDNPPCTSGPTAQDVGGTTLTPDSKELIAPNMRLSKLTVTDLGNNLWQVTVRVAYGDDDLFIDPSPTGSTPGYQAADATCKSGVAGGQFCAVSELSTTVQKRID